MNARDMDDTIRLSEIQGFAPFLYQEPVAPEKTALVIIDMQNTFCYPDTERSQRVASALEMEIPDSRQWMEDTIGRVSQLLLLFRERQLRIVHIKLGCWTADGSELAPHYRRADVWRRENSGVEPHRHGELPESQIIPELEPEFGEIVLQKVTPSAFASTGIDAILRNMGIQYLVIAGTITHGCLGSTALDATYNYAVTIAEDASIAPSEPATHRAWLRLFEQHWGRVKTVEEIEAEITGRAKT